MMRHRVTLESSGYIPGVGLADDGELPSDPIIKESLSLVLENSCLLCDIVLRFKLYKEKKILFSMASKPINIRWIRTCI